MNSVRARVDSHEPEMIADLTAYIEKETPSDDVEALTSGLAWIRQWIFRRLGPPADETFYEGGNYGGTVVLDFPATHDGSGSVALLCHYDTVWPLGTLEDWPVSRSGDRLTGPGAFDMKTGLVQAVWAIKVARELNMPLPSIRLILNGDEEIGSVTSRPVIEQSVVDMNAVLVFEASADGALKTARKGIGIYRLTTHGVEAHAGLDPDRGVSAVDEMARLVLTLHGATDRSRGTTVNVGTLDGGYRSNVTAGMVSADIDIRVATKDEAVRVEHLMRDLKPHHPKAKVSVEGGWNRPIMTRSEGTAHLFEMSKESAAELGFDLRETSVGGASDGNYAAAMGLPVLDGLGAVGDGAHARDEWISVQGMLERTALTSMLYTRLAVLEPAMALHR